MASAWTARPSAICGCRSPSRPNCTAPASGYELSIGPFVLMVGDCRSTVTRAAAPRFGSTCRRPHRNLGPATPMPARVRAATKAKLRSVAGLLLPGAHCRWKAGLRAEVALDGLHLAISKPEILHVAERLSILGPA